MPEQKCLYYKITEYVVISNSSYNAAQRMKNRNKPKPLLKIYTQATVEEMKAVVKSEAMCEKGNWSLGHLLTGR